jgi:hypothetical protein
VARGALRSGGTAAAPPASLLADWPLPLLILLPLLSPTPWPTARPPPAHHPPTHHPPRPAPQEAIAFYRLVAAWLLRSVCPGGQPAMPLPEPPPMEFAALPEWFIEDLADLFLYVSR